MFPSVGVCVAKTMLGSIHRTKQDGLDVLVPAVGSGWP